MTEQAPDPVDRLAEILRQVEPRLPDTRRARGAQALVERLRREADPMAASPGRQGRSRKVLLLSLGLAAAAALLLTFVHRREAPVVRRPSPAAPSAPGESAPLPAPTLDHAALALLRPLDATAGEGGRDRLQARAGEEQRAWLADCGRVVLRGEAALRVEENSPSGIALRLERGTLLVAFDHDGRRGLTVRTRDALVRVTGTVFAVTADDGPTRVAVSRGSVEVAAGGLPISVTAGKSWRVGAASLGAPDASLALALRELRTLDTPAPVAARPRSARAVGVVEPDPDPAASRPPRSTDDGNPATPAAPGTSERAAEVTYRSAEKALAAGQSTVAEALLRGLVANHPSDPLVASASYELGRLAFGAKHYREARERLRAVHDNSGSSARPFHEPASFLLCRSELGLGERDAARACLERFRSRFPDSPHVSSALALLATLRLEARDCAGATPQIEEYLRRFPNGPEASRLKQAAQDCR